MAYKDFKDLTRRTTSDKKLCDKSFNIAKNSKYDGYQLRLASMVYKCFDKKSSATRALPEASATQNESADGGIKNENISNEELIEELHKRIIRKFNKIKVHSPLIQYF